MFQPRRFCRFRSDCADPDALTWECAVPCCSRCIQSPELSFTATAMSCSDPRYRSVVWMEE